MPSSALGASTADIVAIGYPLADLLTDSVKSRRQCECAKLAGLRNDTRYIQISTPIRPAILADLLWTEMASRDGLGATVVAKTLVDLQP